MDRTSLCSFAMSQCSLAHKESAVLVQLFINWWLKTLFRARQKMLHHNSESEFWRCFWQCETLPFLKNTITSNPHCVHGDSTKHLLAIQIHRAEVEVLIFYVLWGSLKSIFGLGVLHSPILWEVLSSHFFSFCFAEGGVLKATAENFSCSLSFWSSCILNT